MAVTREAGLLDFEALEGGGLVVERLERVAGRGGEVEGSDLFEREVKERHILIAMVGSLTLRV